MKIAEGAVDNKFSRIMLEVWSTYHRPAYAARRTSSLLIREELENTFDKNDEIQSVRNVSSSIIVLQKDGYHFPNKQNAVWPSSVDTSV